MIFAFDRPGICGLTSLWYQPDHVSYLSGVNNRKPVLTLWPGSFVLNNDGYTVERLIHGMEDII